MSHNPTASDLRRHTAREALDTLGSHRSDNQRLGVQCAHGHHVAFVYDTAEGLVYWSRTGPHAHGSRDFVDTGRHGARGGGEYVDLLNSDLMADDALPAWCDCGPRTLSRAEMLGHVRSRQSTVRLP